ncbi:hypothetical protein J8273_0372 [Carpediemonas membranifera]|uniref:Uncharacterized protein n=1 Tax=Carpediemonas membranifera TaxID=201153 RepID=A0A8J6E2V8_9EUKA|nr:hypothetical protein J8273_0372 [Carpediemonas membranifera]|eukprot:KAG9395153.1 hypothetical protein J8273_0372 [Carpediemonas membranifera]
MSQLSAISYNTPVRSSAFTSGELAIERLSLLRSQYHSHGQFKRAREVAEKIRQLREVIRKNKLDLLGVEGDEREQIISTQFGAERAQLEGQWNNRIQAKRTSLAIMREDMTAKYIRTRDQLDDRLRRATDEVRLGVPDREAQKKVDAVRAEYEVVLETLLVRQEAEQAALEEMTHKQLRHMEAARDSALLEFDKAHSHTATHLAQTRHVAEDLATTFSSRRTMSGRPLSSRSKRRLQSMSAALTPQINRSSQQQHLAATVKPRHQPSRAGPGTPNPNPPATLVRTQSSTASSRGVSPRPQSRLAERPRPLAESGVRGERPMSVIRSTAGHIMEMPLSRLNSPPPPPIAVHATRTPAQPVQLQTSIKAPPGQYSAGSPVTSSIPDRVYREAIKRASLAASSASLSRVRASGLEVAQDKARASAPPVPRRLSGDSRPSSVAQQTAARPPSRGRGVTFSRLGRARIPSSRPSSSMSARPFTPMSPRPGSGVPEERHQVPPAAIHPRAIPPSPGMELDALVDDLIVEVNRDTIMEDTGIGDVWDDILDRVIASHHVRLRSVSKQFSNLQSIGLITARATIAQTLSPLINKPPSHKDASPSKSPIKSAIRQAVSMEHGEWSPAPVTVSPSRTADEMDYGITWNRGKTPESIRRMGQIKRAEQCEKRWVESETKRFFPKHTTPSTNSRLAFHPASAAKPLVNELDLSV